MSGRELVVLGTASQVPTRARAHHGALLRFDGHGVLFDPGEGTQRQMAHAGLAASAVDRICITHAHGDHCLGLPGVLQRAALDRVGHPLDVHYPAAADVYVRRLRHASAYDDTGSDVRLHPTEPGAIETDGPFTVWCAALSHAVPTLGWRFDQPPGRSFDPDLLADAGVHGAARHELATAGRIAVGGRTVHLEDVSHPRRGRSLAFVMDTRPCDGASELASGADLLVIEATFLESERALAEQAGHLTAAQAVRLAADAGARRVVLTHFSRRYTDTRGHRDEAMAAVPGLDVHVAADLDRIRFP